MTQTDRRALSRWISDDLCAGGQPITAMLEHVFLWCRDRRIYWPSRTALERLVRSQRHLYLEALLARVPARLAPDAVRSEERRVGTECVSACRSRWSPFHHKQNNKQTACINT